MYPEGPSPRPSFSRPPTAEIRKRPREARRGREGEAQKTKDRKGGDRKEKKRGRVRNDVDDCPGPHCEILYTLSAMSLWPTQCEKKFAPIIVAGGLWFRER